MLRVHNSVKGYQCPLLFFPVQCGNINVTNSNLEQPGSLSRVYMYKEKVEFSCDEGHELPDGSPNGTIEYLANGNWSGYYGNGNGYNVTLCVFIPMQFVRLRITQNAYKFNPHWTVMSDSLDYAAKQTLLHIHFIISLLCFWLHDIISSTKPILLTTKTTTSSSVL